MLLRNAIWNQWIEPHAVRYVDSLDRTYFGGVGSGGQVRVSAFDHDARSVETFELATKQTDDHNAPAILVDASGVVWAFYTAHGTESKLYYRKATSSESVAAWGTEVELTTGGLTTYVQVFQASGGRIVLFYRRGNPHRWAMRYTDDGGSNWSTEVTVFDAQDWRYMIAKQSGDTLTVAVGDHPDLGAAHQIHLLTIDLDTGDINVPGGSTLGDIYDGGTLPVDPTSGVLAFDPAAGKTTRLWDVTVNREVLFQTWDTGGGFANSTYHYVTVSSGGSVGTVRDLVASGVTLDTGAAPRGYFAGMGGTATEGVILLAREASGDWSVERWTTVDAGANWSDERIDVSRPYPPMRFRPVAPVNSHADLPALWCEGDYGPTTITEYRTDITGGITMSLHVADRVKETTTTTGTGTVDLAGAADGFRGFVAAGLDGDVVPYCITDGTDWEVGYGTVTDAATDTLSRTTILASSNAGAAVNWGAGTKDVFLTAPADALRYPVTAHYVRTAGNITLDGQGDGDFHDVPSGPEITIPARVGDRVWVHLGGYSAVNSSYAAELDWVTIDAGSAYETYFATESTTPAAGGLPGISLRPIESVIGSGAMITLGADDVVNGQVTVRLVFRNPGTAGQSRTLRADTGRPLRATVINYGPDRVAA